MCSHDKWISRKLDTADYGDKAEVREGIHISRGTGTLRDYIAGSVLQKLFRIHGDRSDSEDIQGQFSQLNT